MGKLILTGNNRDSHIINEDYFPLRVVYDSTPENTRLIGFYFGDTDLLEFSVDGNTGVIKKLQLVICNHFKIFGYDYPEELIAASGSIVFDYPQHNDCEFFSVKVFNNAVDIKLTEKEPSFFYFCGQVVFGVSDEDELSEIIVSEMNEMEIKHTKNELTVCNEK